MTNYLDRAVAALRSAGIPFQSEAQTAPVLGLLDKIVKYDTTKITSIAATLQQSSTFNAAIRDQVKGMDISTRFMGVAQSFTSIREDAELMAGWMADGKLDFKERISLNWMTLRRGSIPDRFNDIRKTYMEVCESAKDQIGREEIILTAYQDFRMSLKSAEVEAQEVLLIATDALNARKAALSDASASVEAAGSETPAKRAALELARDEALRAVQDEDKAFQIVKDIADDLMVGYNTAELVFARLQQAHSVKERLHQRMISFFSTNEVVLSGLSASFTTNAGLSEATSTLGALQDGIGKGLEALGSTGNVQLEAALKAGYGSTVKAESVKALAESVLEFQSSSLKLIEQLRAESTQSANEIEAATEDCKSRFTALLTKVA